MNKVRKINKQYNGSITIEDYKEKDCVIIKQNGSSKIDEHTFYKGIYRFYSGWYNDGRKMRMKILKGLDHGICIVFNY